MKYLLYILLFIPMTVYGEPVINIQMLEGAKNITEILEVQRGMAMSDNPKELSTPPTAICFEANISKFLPTSDSNPKSVYGCIFSDQVAMNASLLRAGLYVHTGMGMADDEQLYNSKLMTAVGGHDFDGKELSNYQKKEKESPITRLDKFQQMNDIENAFHRQVVDPILQHDNENFIFFAIINTPKFKANLSHELLHAQYYDVPQISTLLWEVWDKQVTPEDKEIIIAALTNGGYDMQQQELLLREFYSYFLQYDAENYLASIEVLKPMAPLANKYAPLITKALNSHEITVLTVT